MLTSSMAGCLARLWLAAALARAATDENLVPLIVLKNPRSGSSWLVQLLNSVPRDDVGAKSVEGIISTADSSGVMLLQAAAREASARGAVGERDDGAIKRAYNKLEKLVPGLLNKAGST